MRHTRSEVIRRTIREFRRLDRLVSKLTTEEWKQRLPRPETKDPWTVKDALVHITYRKANMVRTIRKQRRSADERGLPPDDLNRLVYLRWRDRSPQEVLAWHRRLRRARVVAQLELNPYTLGRRFESYWAHNCGNIWAATLNGDGIAPPSPPFEKG